MKEEAEIPREVVREGFPEEAATALNLEERKPCSRQAF